MVTETVELDYNPNFPDNMWILTDHICQSVLASFVRDKTRILQWLKDLFILTVLDVTTPSWKLQILSNTNGIKDHSFISLFSKLAEKADCLAFAGGAPRGDAPHLETILCRSPETMPTCVKDDAGLRGTWGSLSLTVARYTSQGNQQGDSQGKVFQIHFSPFKH